MPTRSGRLRTIRKFVEPECEVTNLTNEEIAVKLTDHDNEIGSLKHRMKEVEGNNKALIDLTGSVRELASDQVHLKSDVGEIKSDVKSLMAAPGKRWDGLVDKLLFTLAGAFLAWLIAGGAGMCAEQGNGAASSGACAPSRTCSASW